MDLDELERGQRGNTRNNGQNKQNKKNTKKTKGQISGYTLFVSHKRKELEAKGERLPHAEAFTRFEADWKALTPAQQERWKGKSKNLSDGVGLFEYGSATDFSISQNVVLTSMGLSSELQQVLDNYLPMNPNCKRQSFVFLHFNHYSALTREKYIPAEYCLVNFSLTKGVYGISSQLIDPGRDESQLMMQCDVNEMVEQYSLPPLGFSENPDEKYKDAVRPRNCGQVLRLIDEALWDSRRSESSPNVIFVLKENLDVVNGCINWLMNKAGRVRSERLHFIPISALLVQLSRYGCEINAVDKACLHEDDTFSILNHSECTYDERVTCPWHNMPKNVHNMEKCSRNVALRTAYLFIMGLVDTFDIDPVEGKHYLKSQVDMIREKQTKEVEFLEFEGIHKLEKLGISSSNSNRGKRNANRGRDSRVDSNCNQDLF